MAADNQEERHLIEFMAREIGEVKARLTHLEEREREATNRAMELLRAQNTALRRLYYVGGAAVISFLANVTQAFITFR